MSMTEKQKERRNQLYRDRCRNDPEFKQKELLRVAPYKKTDEALAKSRERNHNRWVNLSCEDKEKINKKQNENYKKRKEKIGVKVKEVEMHGLTKTRTYKAWYGMKDRVLRSSHPCYERYKGFMVDPRWNKFSCFYEDMGECPEGLTLDRINNEGGYRKDNCRWATRKQQSHNTRMTKLSAEKVGVIRKKYPHVRVATLAREYGVSSTVMWEVCHGKSWKEVSHV